MTFQRLPWRQDSVTYDRKIKLNKHSGNSHLGKSIAFKHLNKFEETEMSYKIAHSSECTLNSQRAHEET